ncbi:MAG: transcription-repair coupling factor, partial [Armatimonadetes bacterium]|nr:transcription-repair coupling factor [Armatimonadota bacterium]
SELAPDDRVVHINYGVGVFRGLISRTVAGVQRDYLQIDYEGTDRLFVPVAELDRIQKYIGPDGVEPTLNSLSDSRWRRTTARARKKAEAVAKDLLELYARRSNQKGHAFGPDTTVQQDMEAAFIYEETPDQLKAIEAIKKDMRDEDPMDRLLCGDVGFGKTEVAIRAAFKATQDGFQVAVLVPTTVLAQQHYATFSERLAPFGCRVEVMSRFRTRKEQSDVLARLAVGEVDVVIGTHRLLSEDVKFPMLGLLIVDEEQRFGVRHKENIKKLRLNVDVLTMSATPIPRTLNTALIGVRELSLLQDPPQGRLPVLTTVIEREDNRLREAILRELERDGQVYFLHNRVRTIERTANRLKRLVPHARVRIGHGQMPEDELEEVMVDLNAGDFDIFVCTSIIESGLDIPNVNTILVDDCEQFGLAQLYQLIGRVGRRERQAYAYLVHRPHKELTADAKRRLEAIQELSELGSGFEIALRDLEIRGAGNMLGVQQSGFIEEVGFELYTQMLADAVRELSGEVSDAPLQLVSEVELPIQANLPASYIPDEKQRLDVYRRLAQTRDANQVLDLEGEVRDRFGRPPAAAGNLFRLVRLRMRCDEAGIGAIKLAGGRHLQADFDTNHELDAKEMRIFARGLQREAKRGRAPRLNLSRQGLTADLREPRHWEPLDAAEAVVRMAASARQELGAEVPPRP